MKAIIHIGTGKTGTTTIQDFLAKNRENLKKQGLFIPLSGDRYGYPARHVELAAAAHNPARWPHGTWWNFMLMEGFTTTDQDMLWEGYRREIEANCNKDDCVLFSCEMLCIFDKQEVEKVKRLMYSLFDDVSVILYCRRQPEYSISSYQALVRAGLPTHFSEHYTPDYRDIVECWSTFGKDNIKVRVFDKGEFHDNDLLADFAHVAGFDTMGLEYVNNQNEAIGSAETEFLRLLNFYIPTPLDSVAKNSADYGHLQAFFSCYPKENYENTKGRCLTREESRQILEHYRERNNWIAREYLGMEKLFSEDVSMYPEEVDSPHGLTLEKCAEITAYLWKERCNVIHQLKQEENRQRTEVQLRDTEIRHLQDNLFLLQQKSSIYWHYYRYKILATLTFGKKRKHYKEKRNALHEKVRQIRNIRKHKDTT